MPRPPENIATARLRLAPPRREDAPEVFAAYGGDPEVTRYLTWRPYAEPGPLAYLIRLARTGVVAGSIGFVLDGNRATFGYVLGRSHWGQGLMTEALRALLDWTDGEPEIFRAWAFCDVDNPASARVMEKAGMTREGILRRWHVAPNLGPEPRDCIVCARAK
jgi:ribosomal-protein-alanine N-acetyltransferase